MNGQKIYQNLIGGAFVDPIHSDWLDSYDPFTGHPWTTIPRSSELDARNAAEAAYDAFTTGPWPSLTATERGVLLRNFADLLTGQASAIAAVETRDNGKIISETQVQVRYAQQWFQYYGGLADKIEGAVLPSDKSNIFNYTKYEPVGPVLAITAWNSPILLAAYKLAPVLAAGNTVVLKPSEYASASTLEFARLFEKAEFPPGVVNVVTGLGPEVGQPLVEDDRIAMVTFTGSEYAGRSIAQTAGTKLKRAVLELGGKSPNIVFEDANLENAANGVISGIFAASGQTCVAGSRLLVHESIHDEFVERLIKIARPAIIGDPADPSTQIGPITTQAQYRKILDYINIAKSEGANCVLGGHAVEMPGQPDSWFVAPTIFTEVTNSMRIACEEVFGPVLSVIKFKDDEDAIQIANDSKFGLAAGVWTNDMRRSIMMSDRLQAGTVWVNTYRAISFLSPFGGYKHSGMGRENGTEAVKQYQQTQSVRMSTEENVANPFVIR